jgi:hypothetical protein
VAGLPRSATFGYLTDVVLPRDCFMHRHDIAQATQRSVESEASDAEVVSQGVRDLGRSWTDPDLFEHVPEACRKPLAAARVTF